VARLRRRHHGLREGGEGDCEIGNPGRGENVVKEWRGGRAGAGGGGGERGLEQGVVEGREGGSRGWWRGATFPRLHRGSS